MEKKTLDYNQLFKDELVKQGFVIFKENEIKEAAEIFTSAFKNYPLYTYFKKKYNYKHWLQWNIAVIKTMYKNAVVFTDQSRSMVAIFCCNQFTGFDFKELNHNGGWKAYFTLGRKAIKKSDEFEVLSAQARKKHTNFDAIYCFVVALKPESQGTWLLLKLNKIIHDFCDKYQRDFYFETHSGKHETMYKRFGYQMVEKIQLPGTDNCCQYCFMYKHK